MIACCISKWLISGTASACLTELPVPTRPTLAETTATQAAITAVRMMLSLGNISLAAMEDSKRATAPYPPPESPIADSDPGVNPCRAKRVVPFIGRAAKGSSFGDAPPGVVWLGFRCHGPPPSRQHLNRQSEL